LSWSALTILNLCSGKTWAKPSAAFGAGGQILVGRRPVLAQQLVSVLDVSAQPELAGDLPGNGQVVAGYHLDLDAMGLGLGDGFGRILAWRVEKR
jgi:hypothetical protein